MTTVEINIELTRLRAYKLDLERSLPKVILEHDSGYAMAISRSEELNKMLKATEAEDATRSAAEQEQIRLSNELLSSMIADLRKTVAKCESKKGDLHPSAMARYFEVVTNTKRVLR